MSTQKDDYSDIIHLPHHRSARHAPMPIGDRAAQFAPFAALKGYDEEIEEAARFTEARVLRDDAYADELDAALRQLMAREGEAPRMSVRCFEPDARKEGGAYRIVSGRLRYVDAEGRRLILQGGVCIPFALIDSVEEEP